MTIHGSLPVWTWPLLLVGAAGAVFWVVRSYRQTRPAARRPYDRLLVVLRCTVVLLLLLAVAGPVLTLTTERSVPASLAVVIEDSGSMTLEDAGEGGDGGTDRWGAALAWAGILEDRLADFDPPVALHLLRGNGMEPLREFRLDDPVIPPPSAHGTDLDALARQVADRLAGGSARAVVLFADGQETGRGSRGPAAGGGPEPLHVVEVGDPRGPADRVLKDLRYPDAAYAGDEVVVEFAVDHRYAAAADTGEVVVTLTGPEGLREEVVLEPGTGFLPGEIVFTPGGSGLQVFELSVSALDAERFLANNRVTLAVDVRRERARVLLVSAAPGWDVRFLAQAALREERLEMVAARPAEDGLVLADSLAAWPDPAVPDPWAGWDGVILLGVPDPDLGLDWGGLAAAVERGAGLMVLPGPGDQAPGGAYGRALPGALAALLPVAVTDWRLQPGSWFFVASGEQSGHPVLEGLVPGAGERRGTGTRSLPPLRHLIRAEARPGAAVLARAGVRSGGEAQGPPLLVAGAEGSGRVVWFGARNLWELAFWDLGGSAAAEHPGRRLLRNLLVWVGTGGEEAGLVLAGRQPFFQEGEPIELAGRWRDLRGRPVTDRSVVLELWSLDADSTRVRTFGMRPVPAEPGLYQASLPPLPPGDYRVRPRGEGSPPVLGTEETLVVAAHSVERTQVRTDRRRLQRLAASGGGDFHSADDPAALDGLVRRLGELDWSPDRVTGRRRLEFWTTWIFLGLVSLLLGAEWFIRRRQGQL